MPFIHSNSILTKNQYHKNKYEWENSLGIPIHSLFLLISISSATTTISSINEEVKNLKSFHKENDWINWENELEIKWRSITEKEKRKGFFFYIIRWSKIFTYDSINNNKKKSTAT